MRPPKTAQRTPRARHRRATSPTAFPSPVVRSTAPSPVTTRSKPAGNLPQAGSAVAVRSPAEPDDELTRPRPSDRAHKLTEATARREQRVELLRVEWNRLGRLDHRRPVLELEPSRAPRAPERVVD